MPTIMDQAKVSVTYHHGVLALRLPKHAATIPQGIAITGQSGRRTWPLGCGVQAG